VGKNHPQLDPQLDKEVIALAVVTASKRQAFVLDTSADSGAAIQVVPPFLQITYPPVGTM
jgi:hypothetical protein